ncbi:Glycogen debranching enzyme (alpha-1,6-glucosidase) [Micromonospora echinaurantiaca]|uniref:Glycogen debranching enzyme (Alpha-1,6-glucosidase) n=1 Tax=Micromonospora echinaurantiaca TaxID=47857 RepID=A0A1C5IF72_9ACTN|nr:glycogen debranching N-terminal domain-containing protein [Micromonospora echinaurantiaca]SCG57088.1 Glycogen debranching enzyme (alpha-1,6-glucosidase) [Micromonospora echinaurantiaca]
MTEPLVRILDGSTFLVSDDRGDIDEIPTSSPTGFFVMDTRHLSRWVLTVNGKRLTRLSVDDVQYYEARFFLVPGPATQYVDAKLSIFRHRWIGGSFHEKITIINHGEEVANLTVRVEARSDFADLFEVKGTLNKKGRYYQKVEPGRICLGYERETFRRETVITTARQAEVDENGLTYVVRIEPLKDWTVELTVETHALDQAGHDIRAKLKQRKRRSMRNDLEMWQAQMPRIECDWEPLTMTCQRSIVDLAALRLSIFGSMEGSLPAAGLPWFMTVFGRDSIFTSLQVLPFAPELAAMTLRLLGSLQGVRVNDFREEDPGKILHELRFGESSAFYEQPHSPYFGSADSTPLWVILLDEYERWSGDVELVRTLEPEARAALDWIDRYGDLMGNGYLSYRRRNEINGLENQCWKDSWDSISFRDGRFPGFPRATCELQGYAYDAKVRGARLARLIWGDDEYANRLNAEATDLKRRFNRDFWIDERNFYALALDENGRKVDALSSNIGHLLWSGIVDEPRAKMVVDHLLGPDLFSGWGVRTLGRSERRFNPVGYHVGTVWPFDNSLISWGLRRYGFLEEAGRIAKAIFDAARYFQGRLPEAFAGYDRQLTMHPVEYPTACSPQAWSTGAPLLLVRTLLGLDPLEEHLIVAPKLPVGIERLALLDIPGRWGRTDAFGRYVTRRGWRPR